MTPFQIHCKECSAKLTIRKPSLVGKTVRCPACRGQVHVIRPRRRKTKREPTPAAADEPQTAEKRTKRRKTRQPKRADGTEAVKQPTMTGENPSENFDARWRAVGVTVVAIVVMGLGITRTIRRWQRQATLAQTIMTYEGKGKGKGYTPVDGSLPPEQQARAAVAQMVEQLDAGDYAAFIEAHGPIDELNRSSGSSRSAGSERLADLFREMQTWSFTVAPGNVNKVVLSDPTPDPPVPNRYAEIIDWDPNWDPTSRSSKRPPPGYGQPYRVGVNETLELAIADLEQGKYERFMEHMFPPSVTAMMKADERWTGLVASMTAQSPLVTRMIEDLKEMLIATPEMSGKNYASYRLPRRVEVDGQERVVGKKFISLNRIAHWRFTDEKTKKFRRAYGTMLSQTASRHEFVLEKANGQWRLPYIP